MARYNYDKSALKGLTTKDFMNQVEVRQSHINAGSTDMPVSVFGPNKIAKALHPDHLEGRIVKKIQIPTGIMYIIVPARDRGFEELPSFLPGQHITFDLDTPDALTKRNYCIISAPSAAKGERGSYTILVSEQGPGHASEFIHNTWQEGDIVRFSAPAGECYYDPIRDSKDILAIGIGGPSMALCYDIMDGAVDVNYTALALMMSPEYLSILGIYQEMQAKVGDKIQVVPLLLNGEAEGVEKGFVTADLIRRVMTDKDTGEMKDMTILLTLPEPLYGMVYGELKKLGIPDRRIRKEQQGSIMSVFDMESYPAEKVAKQYSLKVWVRGECTEVACSSDKTLAEAVEAARICLKTSCRSGHCGICHSRLISGEFFMPKSMDGRREADKKFGWIHPCCTYPLSDMEIEVFPKK